jgi:putative two-component system response regulator
MTWNDRMTSSHTTETNSAESDLLRFERQFQSIDALLSSGDHSAPAAGDAQISSAQILIIDDEPVNLKVAKKYLKEAGYQNVTATNDSRNALSLIRQQQPALILLDLMMPDVDGLELLRALRADPSLRQIPVIVLTATDERSVKREALELGASDFLTKPVDPTDLLPRIRNVLGVKAFQDHLQHYARELERQVHERTAELETSRLEVIYCLGRAAEYRDNETGKHVVRVGRFVGVIARALGLDEKTAALFENAAPLHDMGKIGIPDAVLLKPGRLDESEFEIMRKHAEYGCDIVSTINRDSWKDYASHTQLGAAMMHRTCSPLLRAASIIALTHHEKWDGSGYPNRLKGEEIPIEGRITAVADVFDALSSKRPYKPALPFDECFKVMEENRGTHFDPHVLDAFFSRKDQIIRIKLDNADEE